MCRCKQPCHFVTLAPKIAGVERLIVSRGSQGLARLVSLVRFPPLRIRKVMQQHNLIGS
jgi:hypothetical protein